ncbi:MAG: photosystem I reaction center subunit PsaK [Gomphosphaeria aponina SAG 52.96 = DSM 107014]|uniref:Photosystem I reaction center subunit PsaK n=1 Tax=Gomphosphaeria aponina SAG 52.96 = DSM 107014 TaxID=1521640 RepID=A0A941JNN0_9CHRO|nr:photosystem I reaction center subunit PsaK [Gomphosphaeria aponina SAG 52.96 = DSM 107014]
MNSTLLFAVQTVVPQTTEWNFSVAIIMIACNIFAIAIGRFAIQQAGSGPDLPVGKPALWKNFGIPELLATTSFGHILGAGLILGLGSAGIL